MNIDLLNTNSDNQIPTMNTQFTGLDTQTLSTRNEVNETQTQQINTNNQTTTSIINKSQSQSNIFKKKKRVSLTTPERLQGSSSMRKSEAKVIQDKKTRKNEIFIGEICQANSNSDINNDIADNNETQKFNKTEMEPIKIIHHI